MSVFVAAHKPFTTKLGEGYVPIHVGKAISSIELDFQGDNTGDNISSKNRNFCELTGLYWIWKNTSDDIVGLVHYRRYFFNRRFNVTENNIISMNEIKTILKEKDIILPKKTVMLKKTVYTNYKDRHRISDLDICGEIIQNRYPDYIFAFEKLMNSHKYYSFNMFITKWAIFNSYMGWLFTIFDEVESRIDITGLDSYNTRVYGFLAERLLNVWIIKHSELKIRELPVYNIESKLGAQYMQMIQDGIKSVVLR